MIKLSKRFYNSFKETETDQAIIYCENTLEKVIDIPIAKAILESGHTFPLSINHIDTNRKCWIFVVAHVREETIFMDYVGLIEKTEINGKS